MHEPGLTDDAVAAIRSALLDFYAASARDLPWRRTRDPYAIWISEVMAQQTRVDTVVPYYERWLRRFPDVETLAAAPVDHVLKEWEGLGYYRRARHLHAAARVVRERHAGVLPSSAAELRALPGVGAYTAGAVASIAFGAVEPAIDGNVRRVLSRLLDEPEPAPARLRAVAAALVPRERPGEFNQALMELGATVCTPRSPRCDDCPVRAFCGGRAAGTLADRPRRRPARTVPLFAIATLILRAADGRVLLQRRPPTGLLAGLWSFPGRELRPGEDAAAAAREIASELTGRAHDAAHLGDIEHVFSHRRERYLCHTSAFEPGTGRRPPGTWLGVDPSALALPRAQQKIHALAFASATCPVT
jgi:A/G-specific adenine glycosylase